MCTVVSLRRPGHDWPVLIAANRDEMNTRPWKSPARHWPDRPEVVAGLDELADGSWMGINDYGLVAAVLNRYGTLGPQDGKRSRGELVLDALDHADAVMAAEAFSELNAEAYRPFNMLIADNQDAYWIANLGDGPIRVQPVPDGLHMLTAHDMDDAEASNRVKLHLPLFEDAEIPDPDKDEWSDWIELLSSRRGKPTAKGMIDGAMRVQSDFGFETSSASLLALPKDMRDPAKWLFAAGKPDEAPFKPVLPAED